PPMQGMAPGMGPGAPGRGAPGMGQQQQYQPMGQPPGGPGMGQQFQAVKRERGWGQAPPQAPGAGFPPGQRR
ncbi:hypothetical protein KIPB_012407, partial [Kipferlia bialata]